jgi:hypothetical protein
MRRRSTLAAVLALVPLAAAPDSGGQASRSVDAQLVTAIDASDSVSQTDMRRQLAGLADALRAPDVLAAIKAGRSRRIAVAVFVWHHGQIDVVPWTIIGSADDADVVARTIEARMAVNLDAEARVGQFYAGRLTDLSRAIDHAEDLLAAASFPAGRQVVNVIGNGPDNMGEPAVAARDRLLAGGVTLNAVALGGAPELVAYFRAEVAGGPDAFVLPSPAGAAMADLMRRKLLGDLVAAGAPTTPSQAVLAANARGQ